MPLRRPLSSDAASSRLPVPSGLFPGDVEVGCVEFQRVGEGAGPNCVPLYFSRVLDAKYKGLDVISVFSTDLSVRYISSVEHE